jgi:hypothetical protein
MSPEKLLESYHLTEISGRFFSVYPHHRPPRFYTPQTLAELQRLCDNISLLTTTDTQRATTMCVKHVNIFACGHERSYLLTHTGFIADPASCPHLQRLMFYVVQSCGSCDWEEDDGVESAYQ